MTEMEAIRLFKCLADKSRVQIVKSLSVEDMYVERLSERLGLSAPTVSFHLKKLQEAGLVKPYRSQYYTVYVLNREVLRPSLMELLQGESSEAELQAQREAAYRQKVLDTFLQHGRLAAIPSQRKKQRIILEELVKVFEPGKVYPEREVNLLLADFNDDFCTLRRDLISEGLMSRDKTGYRRLP